ncbi:MAG TPA: NfeD family protein [Candidatus Deferrimicrobium sp.]|nr:NfeD family protein [Candidatus Deferrimicrobium sp.]
MAEEIMFDDAIQTAESLNVDLILLELDTPGGLVDSVKQIMAMFDNSPIPICIWIPVGGAAWSGGTYLMMASHIAAMASPSVIGSCQPVGNDGHPITDSKYVNPLIELMKEHARIHDRNQTLAEEFITENTNLGPIEALNNDIIEFVANDPNSLLNQLNNYMLITNQSGSNNYTTLIQTFGGAYFNGEVVANFTALEINSAEIIEYNPSISIYIIRFITNPTVVSVFLTVGSFGLIIGLTTTNTHLDEIVGGIALIIGLIGIGIIGIAVGAIVLFIIGLAFFLAEIKFDVGFNGSLAIGGGVCIAIASLFIIPSANYWTRSDFLLGAKWGAFGISIAFIAFFSMIAIKVLQTKKLKSDLDTDALKGARGYVKKELKPEGQVIVKSEEWSAIAVEGTWPIYIDEEIEVVKIDGLRLIVRPLRD